MPIQIRRGTPQDREQLAQMQAALWPEACPEEHGDDILPVLEGLSRGTLPEAVYVAETADHVLAGFVEVGLRSHADGCDPRHPVGFVEGWYVLEGVRQQGIGAKLLRAAEDWARAQGCVEMASDTWIHHTLSQQVHEALGFEVVDRCVHYRKSLENPESGG